MTGTPDPPYTEDYYLNGVATGLSNYVDYHWMPDKTGPMAWQLRWLLNIHADDSILDFGCSRGYLVKALRQMGLAAHGYDISEWAIANCDPEVKPYVSNKLDCGALVWDHIIAKDVFEHIHPHDLRDILEKLLHSVRKQIYIIVPLTEKTNGKYLCPVDEQDTTHVIRWTLPDWLEYLQGMDNKFVVTGGYQAPIIKPNCYEFPASYGFFTMRRLLP